MANVSYSTIAALRKEDEKMQNAMQFIVPVKHDTGVWGPSTYQHTTMPPISDKITYSRLLTGQEVTPQLQITDEDVKAVKDKEWMATLYDFDNWVGEYLEPNRNPANKALLSKIYPEWLERQKNVIENYHDFKKRVETLKITGPKNKEDLFLFYRLGYPRASDQGRNDGFSVYANRIDAPALGGLGQNGLPTAGDATVNFQRGVFNLNRKRMEGKALYGHKRSIFPDTQYIPTGDVYQQFPGITSLQ